MQQQQQKQGWSKTRHAIFSVFLQRPTNAAFLSCLFNLSRLADTLKEAHLKKVELKKAEPQPTKFCVKKAFTA